MSKEMWIAEYDRLYSENMDRPKSEQKTDDQICDQATKRLRDKLADMGDYERKRRREQQ